VEFKVNITLSVDEQTAEKAREAAALMGKSLNQAVRLFATPRWRD
jgi:antitoxin component of RelBE/YafQ-DinJ toxin-antitoxin module